MDISYLGAVTAGLLSFLSPCVLPLVPPYLAFLAGTTLHDAEAVGAEAVGAEAAGAESAEGDHPVRGRIFLSGLAFVLGFSTVFIALGATASAISRLVIDYMHLLAPMAGVVIVALGLHFLGLLRISALYREARFHVASKPAGLIGAYVVGLAFAFGWTPCVGPALAAILMIAGSENSIGYGASLLAAYAFGIGIPFLAAALAAGPFMGFMRRFRRHLGKVEKAMGLLLVLTGILFLTGSISDIAYWLLDTFPTLGRVG